MGKQVCMQAVNGDEVGVKQTFTFELASQRCISQAVSRKQFLTKILVYLNNSFKFTSFFSIPRVASRLKLLCNDF